MTKEQRVQAYQREIMGLLDGNEDVSVRLVMAAQVNGTRGMGDLLALMKADPCFEFGSTERLDKPFLISEWRTLDGWIVWDEYDPRSWPEQAS